MSVTPADLAELLRRYAKTEHGKRAALHSEIMRIVLGNPNGIAGILDSAPARSPEGWPSEEQLEAAARQIHYDLGCTITAARLAAAKALKAASPAAPTSGAEQTHDGEAPGPFPLTANRASRASESRRDGPSPPSPRGWEEAREGLNRLISLTEWVRSMGLEPPPEFSSDEIVAALRSLPAPSPASATDAAQREARCMAALKAIVDSVHLFTYDEEHPNESALVRNSLLVEARAALSDAPSPSGKE